MATEIMNDTILALHYQAIINKMFLDPHVTPGYDADLFKETSIYLWLPSKEFEGFTDIKADPKKFYVGEPLDLKSVVKAGFRLFNTPGEQAKALLLERSGVSTLAKDGSEDDPDADEGEDVDEGDDEEDQTIQEVRALAKPSFKPVKAETPPPPPEEAKVEPYLRAVAKQKEGSLDYKIVELLKKQTEPLTKVQIAKALPEESFKTLSLRLGYVVNGRAVSHAVHDNNFVYWIEGVVQTSLVPIVIGAKVRKKTVTKKQKAALLAQEIQERAEQEQRNADARAAEKSERTTAEIGASLELRTITSQPSLNLKPVKVARRRSIDDDIKIHLTEDTEVSMTSKGHILIVSGDVTVRLSGDAALTVHSFMKSMPLLEKA
jgi:hypothetical protein